MYVCVCVCVHTLLCGVYHIRLWTLMSCEMDYFAVVLKMLTMYCSLTLSVYSRTTINTEGQVNLEGEILMFRVWLI